MALDDPTDRRVLAPMAEREVLYHLLVGEQGERLRAVALRDTQAHRIARAGVRTRRTRRRPPLRVRQQGATQARLISQAALLGMKHV